jgi:hypothetical protein
MRSVLTHRSSGTCKFATVAINRSSQLTATASGGLAASTATTGASRETTTS